MCVLVCVCVCVCVSLSMVVCFIGDSVCLWEFVCAFVYLSLFDCICECVI